MLWEGPIRLPPPPEGMSYVDCKHCGGGGYGHDTLFPTFPPIIGPASKCWHCGGAGKVLSDEPPRPSWDEIWMDFAHSLRRRSTCSRASVGAVVVSEDNSVVLGMGYNGGAAGVFNKCLSDEPGKCGHLHAEINALVKTNYRDGSKKKIYVTTSPCHNCATAIINAKIEEVIYDVEYRITDGLELLRKKGLKVRQFHKEGQ